MAIAPRLVRLGLAAASLAACSQPESNEGILKEVADLRARVQSLDSDNAKLKEQVARAERRLGGVEQDVATVRGSKAHVAAAASSEEGSAAAPGSAPAADAATQVVIPNAPQIKAFLDSEEGRKAVASTVKAVQEEQRAEQMTRMVEGMVDRFAKTANLTEDQTKKMKAVMGKQSAAMREAWSALQNAPASMSTDERDQLQQKIVAKTDELRKSTDEEVKGLLSQTQFEQYQQQQAGMRGMRGMGGGGFGGMGGAGGGGMGGGGGAGGGGGGPPRNRNR